LKINFVFKTIKTTYIQIWHKALPRTHSNINFRWTPIYSEWIKPICRILEAIKLPIYPWNMFKQTMIHRKEMQLVNLIFQCEIPTYKKILLEFLMNQMIKILSLLSWAEVQFIGYLFCLFLKFKSAFAYLNSLLFIDSDSQNYWNACSNWLVFHICN